MSNERDPAAIRAGLFDSLRGLLGTAVALSQNRLGLLGVELAEEQNRVLSLLVYGAAAFTFLSLGLVFFAIFLTVLLWDTQRLLVLGMFSTLFIGAGSVTLIIAKGYAQADTKLFSASLAELNRDSEALADALPYRESAKGSAPQ